MFKSPEIRQAEEGAEEEKKEWNNKIYEVLLKYGLKKGSKSLEDLELIAYMLKVNPDDLLELESDLARGIRKIQNNADALIKKRGLEGITPEDLKKASEKIDNDVSLIEMVKEEVSSREIKEAA